MQLWIWRNFRFYLPVQWEMLQYSRNPERGRCAFADRYQFRFELNWRKVPGPPDFERMMSDYHAKLAGKEKRKQVKRIDIENWNGIEARTGKLLTSRFGRFFRSESCIVELVFTWLGQKDINLIQQVLASFAEEPEHQQLFRRWCAFGMDFLVSKDLLLEQCRVEPSTVQMIFAKSATRQQESFARYGMVKERLHISVGEWLCDQLKKFAAPAPVTTYTVNTHKIEYTNCKKRIQGLRGIMGAQLRHDAAAWICPQDGRLYHISLMRPDRELERNEKLAGARLSCCANLALVVKSK